MIPIALKVSSKHYCKCFVVALLAVMPTMALAAWQTIFSDQGKRVDIDRSTITKVESGKSEALGRIVLDKPINDPKTSSHYRIIEALNRYDCNLRTYGTLRRTYFIEEGELLRQEEVKTLIEMPVRSGTLDDKLLREVCRPKPGPEALAAASKMAEQVGVAADELRKANETTLHKEAKVERVSVSKPEAKPEAKPENSEHKPEPKSEHKPEPAPVLAPVAKPAIPAPVSLVPKPHSAKPSALVERHGGHGADAHAHIHWSYEGEGGPDNWGKLKPDYASCANGQRQSPIDIRDGIRVDLAPIQFTYRPSPFRVFDNGHTVQVSVSGSSITLLGKTYELVQFHFHRPSEERVNGKSFEMVAHLVHKAEDGKLAVVAVLLEKGRENPTVQMAWNNLPLEKNEEVIPPGLAIDVAQLLPENRNYYTYMGSLTTPPCSEGVLWLVLKQAQQISPEQLAIFARLYPNNIRPLQPSYSRLIKESR
jgi:carbonic anhydrase